MKIVVIVTTFFAALAVAGFALLATATAVAAPACQSYKSPVQCEVGGKCIWTVSKGKKSQCLPLAKAKAPRRG